MKSVAVLLFTVLLTFSGQGQVSSFYKVFTGNGYDRGNGVAQLSDSSYLITGTSSSFEDAPSQAFILHLDKNGEFLWSKAYGGAEFEEGSKILPLEGYGYFISGTSSSGASADFDVYTVFTNESGDFQWETFHDVGAWERVHDAVLMPDTSIVIVGETDNTVDGNTDMLLMRLKKDGSQIWSQQIGTSGDDIGNAILKTSDTTFVVVGSRYVSDSVQNKGLVAEFHIDGSFLWDTLLGVNGNYWLNDVARVGNEYKVAGERIKTGYTDHDVYRASVSLIGDLLFAEEYYQSDDARYVQFVNYAAGTGDKYFVAVQSINPSIPTYADGEDDFIFRYNEYFYWDGYGVGYSGVGQDQVNHMINTLDGYAILVGYHTTYGSGGNSIMVVKIGDENNFPAFSTDPDIENLVFVEENPTLEGVKVYPNPVQDVLHVQVGQQWFNYRVTTSEGTVVYSGKAQEQLDIATEMWAKGVYFLFLESDQGTALVKIIR